MAIHSLINLFILSTITHDAIKAFVFAIVGDVPKTLEQCIYLIGFSVLIEAKRKMGDWFW